ncbi:MAG TPA: hypothetical protein VE153_05480 [Myxococcus sp.]|nr:hypothetical protein [Myxococcus sp.]
MRALACVVMVWTLVACSKPSEPSGPAAAGAQAPDASPVTAAATGGTATAPRDAGLDAQDAGTAADAGTAVDAGTANAPAADTELPAMCRSIASRYESIQKAAPLTCKVDADCSCHLVLTQDRVLAVSDRVTAAKLQSMSMAYRKARCPTAPATASPACEPKCQAGKCR